MRLCQTWYVVILSVWQVLMVAARTMGGLIDSSTIEEIESDLAKVIEDFDRAVNIEALRRIKETGEHLSPVMVSP